MPIDSRCPMVALVDSAKLQAGPWLQCLSAQEGLEFRAFGHERRRQEWLAGRIAAKFVYLKRLEENSGLVEIDARTLEQFSLDAYRNTVVVKNSSPQGGLVRVGGEMLETAISHVKGLACATLASGEFRSIDLEARAVRVPQFYTGNFTAREREWALESSTLYHLDLDWLYTLLWSAKECLLKTSRFAGVSLWNIGSINIDVLAGSERLGAFSGSAGFAENFEFLRAETTGTGPYSLAVAGNAEFVLTAISTDWKTETA